tara:strand:- start:673 stop:1158 length:486 start_codon:yes stop_codon:yes gene_type:complete
MDELFLKKNKIKNLSGFLVNSSKSQGNDDIKKLYSWKYEENIIVCYGWYDGEAGFENKHDLPPYGESVFLDEDSSTQLLFGDIFMICYDKDDNIINFNVSDYGVFYNFIFGGFDDCDDSDDIDNISYNTDEDEEIINEITDEEYELSSNDSEDLEYDDNEY